MDGIWRVLLHNDDVNSVVLVVHVIQTLCGVSKEQAVQVATDVHMRRWAEVGTFPDQTGAEGLAVALQRYGLHAMVRRP